jgi:hypothetical protein
VIWIFALGVLCLCVFSKGFRKFTIVTVAVVVVGVGGLAAIAAYQNNVQKQETAQAARAREAKLRACVGKDQSQAYLEAGGNCRMVADDNVNMVLVSH